MCSCELDAAVDHGQHPISQCNRLVVTPSRRRLNQKKSEPPFSEYVESPHKIGRLTHAHHWDRSEFDASRRDQQVGNSGDLIRGSLNETDTRSRPLGNIHRPTA